MGSGWRPVEAFAPFAIAEVGYLIHRVADVSMRWNLINRLDDLPDPWRGFWEASLRPGMLPPQSGWRRDPQIKVTYLCGAWTVAAVLHPAEPDGPRCRKCWECDLPEQVAVRTKVSA